MATSVLADHSCLGYYSRMNISMHQVWRYVFCLTEEERVRFQRQARRDDYRVFYGVISGIAASVALFFSQLPWHGEPHPYHTFVLWGMLPVGAITGLSVWHWCRWRTYRLRRDVWWPIFVQRWTGDDLRAHSLVEPERFWDIVNRRIVSLGPVECSAFGIAAGFYLQFSLQGFPEYAGTWVARLAYFCLPVAGALLGALAGKRYRDSFARRYSRLK